MPSRCRRGPAGCDLKPENVFLHRSRFGEVIKVLDFGIAKLLGGEEPVGSPPASSSSGIMGTPTYMAPERLRNAHYDGRSDVYSVGVMLYEMLCGQVPFGPPAQGGLEMMLGRLTQAPLHISDLNPNLPAPIAAVVMRTLERDPQLRPTAREMLTELVQAIKDSVGKLDFSDGPLPAKRRADEALAALRGLAAEVSLDDLDLPQSAPPPSGASLPTAITMEVIGLTPENPVEQLPDKFPDKFPDKYNDS